MSIDAVKVDIDEEDDFKSLYICALMMMSGDSEEGLLIAHSECVSMRDQMEVDYETDDPTLGSIH